MAELKKYDMKGKECGSVAIDDALINAEINKQLLKDYIVAIRANARQWSANTKGRSEINCTKKKPRPQKGSGNARQGFLGAPQFKGGGIVFGPKPKFDQHVRINKKERRAAIRAILSEMIQNDKVAVLEVKGLKEPQTKVAQKLVDGTGFAGKRLLVLGQGFGQGEREGDAYKQCELLVKSMRNLPKVSFMPASAVSGYDVIHADSILLTDGAVDELQTLLGRG